MSNINLIARIEWKLYKRRKRRRLTNPDASIIASNCNAGIILHDLGLRFNTPTINLFFPPADYLKFLQRLPHYLSFTPTQAVDDSVGWPVGDLDDVRIHFMHYKDFAEAQGKWCERSKRLDLDNLFVLMSDRNECTYQQMQEFDTLPHQHKVIFTHRPYPEIKSAYCIPGFEQMPEVGVLTDFKPGFWRRRYIDDFDYVAFLNGESVEKINANRSK